MSPSALAMWRLLAVVVLVVQDAVHGSSDPSERVWHHFQEIMKIPRCSGHEGAMKEYLRGFANLHLQRLEALGDRAGNVIVKRPGSGDGASAAPVILQAHLDMVCEKSSHSQHDWQRDPVRAERRDGWLVADETTLGADNGVGVALILSLLEQPSDFHAPPIEAVFTIEEESGLTGAAALDVSLLKGKRLLNFDSEEWGIIYIGCAGGGYTTVSLPVLPEPLPNDLRPCRLALSGLRGGHSGVDIHEDRGNAVLLLARAMEQVQERVRGIRLFDFQGGSLNNAIPREASAIFGVKDGASLDELGPIVASIQGDFQAEYGRIDPNLTLHFSHAEPATVPSSVFSAETGTQLIDLLLTLPYGVIKRSHEIDGIVETSNNVANVRRSSSNVMEVGCFARSSLPAALDEVRRSISRAARLNGATVLHANSMPGWAPNRSQRLLAAVEDVYEEALGSKPEVTAIHAGLECGIIGQRITDLDMVSFGPDIVGAHAPGERVRIESVRSLVEVVHLLLRRLARSGPGSGESRVVEL